MANVARPGIVFLVVFIAAVILSGDVAGSFADPDSQFVSIYADASNRAEYVAGALLLVLAGLSFVWFAYALSSEAGNFRVPLLITGAATAMGMIIAALAWATVPLSISFGALVDDPGFESGQSVLPQFGWVAFGVGSMLPAGTLHRDRGKDARPSPSLARSRQLSDRHLGRPDRTAVLDLRSVRHLGHRGDGESSAACPAERVSPARTIR